MHLTRRDLTLLAAVWLVLAVLVGVKLWRGGDVALALEAWCGGIVSALIALALFLQRRQVTR